jgi:RNA recognition motif-containing protein
VGEVTDAHVVTDRESRQSRGFGFVTMGTPDLATNAIETMNGALIDGRSIRVNEAEEGLAAVAVAVAAAATEPTRLPA